MVDDCTFHTVLKSPLRSLVKLIVGNLQSRYGAVESIALIVRCRGVLRVAGRMRDLLLVMGE